MKLNRKYHSIWTEWPVVLVLLVLAVLGAAVILQAANEQEHGGCAEYRETGGITCLGDATYRHCTPDKECVRYGDGTRP